MKDFFGCAAHCEWCAVDKYLDKEPSELRRMQNHWRTEGGSTPLHVLCYGLQSHNLYDKAHRLLEATNGAAANHLTPEDGHPRRYTPLQTMGNRNITGSAQVKWVDALVRNMTQASLLNTILSGNEGTFAHMFASAGAWDSLEAALWACREVHGP